MTRTLLLALGLLLAAAPLRGQTGTIQVSLTILEPVTAQVEPHMQLRSAPGGVEVQARVNLRGGAAWSVTRSAALPPADAAAFSPMHSDCGPWRGRAAPEPDPLRRTVSVNARCATPSGAGSASAPLVITLVTN